MGTFLYVTARYATGYPSAWTVLDPRGVSVTSENGRKAYRAYETPLVYEDMVQVTRDPRGGLRGTSVCVAVVCPVRAGG